MVYEDWRNLKIGDIVFSPDGHLWEVAEKSEHGSKILFYPLLVQRYKFPIVVESNYGVILMEDLNGKNQKYRPLEVLNRDR